jgi:UMF1 family MFS transporter
MTVALALPGEGQWIVASIVFAVAAFLWAAGNIFYDGFLPELTDDAEQMDAISSAGYGIGYLGGGLMLLLNVVMLLKPEVFGLAGKGAAAKACFVLVGLWWIGFTVPMLVAVKEAAGPAPVGRRRRGYVRQGLAQLRTTLAKIRGLPELAKFLVAFLLYNTGIGTIFVVAAKFATSLRATGGLQLDQGTVIGALLMIQFVGLPAAFAFIWLARKIGNRVSIFVGIAV